MGGKQSKDKPHLSDKRFDFIDLPAELQQEIADLLSIKDKKVLLSQQGRFFKKKFDAAKRAYPLLKAVITGNLGANPREENPNSVISLVKENPQDLFLQGDISFPNGCDLYLLPALLEDMSVYKGCYVWLENNKDLMYVRYDGIAEEVSLSNINYFHQHILSLPVVMLWLEKEERAIALSQKEIKAFITDNGGHKPTAQHYFYNVSAFQLMCFFYDVDMIQHVMRLMSPLAKELGLLMNPQLQELGIGGADIINVNRDPQDNDFAFENLLHYETSYRVDNMNDGASVTFSLLENPDGLVYYKDPAGIVHLYLACAANKTIKAIDIVDNIPFAEQQLLDKMMANIEAMEPMSAKRSNKEEHYLMAKYLRCASTPVVLHQQGITFELEGVRFQSNCYDFNRRFNAYRKCERLFSNNQREASNQVWRQEVGHIQKEVMWLVQRDCEERSYYPLPDFKSSPFSREFVIYNTVINKTLDAYNDELGQFTVGFGSAFALYKGNEESTWGIGNVKGFGKQWRDLVAGIQLVAEAKAQIIKLEPKQNMLQCSKFTR